MTTPPGHGVVITATQMYQELRRHNDLLVKLCEKLDRGRYEERITALEHRVWWLSGAATVAGAALGRLLPL
ncbi:hypothetical protein AB0903_27415 [Streptomyces sp. NPDC048389]|uniref:hypothetical protein n=1 Tax=Streptomyces sp. NPDC048389 TaxID=3154622 RepID=UPI0034520577